MIFITHYQIYKISKYSKVEKIKLLNVGDYRKKISIKYRYDRILA